MTFSVEWVFGTLITVMMALVLYLARRIGEIERDYVRRDDAHERLTALDKKVDGVSKDVKELSALVLKVLISLGGKAD